MREAELGVQAFWLVLLAGALSGYASWWFFRRCSNPTQLRAAMNGIVAHLLELRLFASEPALVLRAQRDLFVANFHFLRHLIAPSLVLVLPFGILLIALDSIFGRGPLTVGKPAIVTLDCRGDASFSRSISIQLEAPAGIVVDSPPVHVRSLSQVSWRVLPIRSAKGELVLHYGGSTVAKSISSDSGLQWLSETRAGSLWRFLRQPSELPFSSATIAAVSISYPAATIFRLNWLVWFTLASLAGAAVCATYLSY